MQATTEGWVAEAGMILHRRLIALYGEPAWRPDGDAISQIVNTILSQNTSDINRDRAFGRLRERFPAWEEVLQAPLAEIEEAIRPAGMSRQRAPRIQQALAYIARERGALSLDFLRELPAEQANAWLTAMHGIGPKTAAIILLFSLGMPAFPVDTHVHRVTRRLGLAPEKASAPQVQKLMEAAMPPETYYAFHINLITHGRRMCKAQRPLCSQCPLSDLCEDYRRRQVGEPPIA